MKELFNKPNRWFDSLKEPKRFYIFILFIGFPCCILSGFYPHIGVPIIITLLVYRYLYLIKG